MSHDKHFQEQVLDLVLASAEEPINKVAALLNAAAMMAQRMGFTIEDMASTMRTAYRKNQARWRQYDREEAGKDERRIFEEMSQKGEIVRAAIK